jgi:biopolymer transport protein ExbD
MADIQTGKGKGSPRVDLTAMVDLGFLLITFFMFTTTLNKPKTMEIQKPAKPDNPVEEPPIKQSRTLSILLGEQDKVYWYVGADDAENIELDSADFSSGNSGIRKVILRRQEEVKAMYGSTVTPEKPNNDKLVVIIKSMPTAKYRSMVNIMDEMNITDTKIYAIVDLDRVDSMIMKQVGQGVKYPTAPVATPSN